MKALPHRAVAKHPRLVTHAVGPLRRIRKRWVGGDNELLECGHVQDIPSYPNGRGTGVYFKLTETHRRCAQCPRIVHTKRRTTYARLARLRKRGLL